MAVRIHVSADVSEKAKIGEDTSIWHNCQIREDVTIGKGCIFGKGVYVDAGVSIGDHVKIQNYVSIFHGVTIEDGVFIGPHVCFTNDMRPRAINPDGTLKAGDDWELSQTFVKYGAALGANSTIRCGVTIGDWAMVGCGSVVTKDVPAYGLVMGNPAKLHGYVCPSGDKLVPDDTTTDESILTCPKCGFKLTVGPHAQINVIFQEAYQ